MVLKWIVGTRVDHPLADPRQARALIGELPPHDYLKALDEVTRWLESLPETEGFKLERLFEIVDLLDTTARSHQRRLVQDYLGMTRQQKFQENKLWTGGHKFAKALGNAYLHCLRQYRSGAGGAAAVKKQIPLFVTRGIRALAGQVKWTMLRYGPFETGLWSSIGELYTYAEKNGYADHELALYSGQRGTSSAAFEYLKVLMLWASSVDVMPPLKQEIAERAISSFAKSFRLARDAFPGALYGFDPARDKPPVRLFGDVQPVPDMTFFGPGDAPAQLAEALATVERTGAVPASVNLGAPYPVEAVLGVMKHLGVYWSDKPPARVSERRATTARITVVPGYFALLDELERDESDALNFSVSSAESWIVENVSDNGYGALVPASTTDWIRVGEMIGLQVEGTPQWGVGLVRRVTRDEQRQFHVGIEIIARSVSMVSAAPAAAGAAGGEGENAVLLAPYAEPGVETGLIVRAGRYDPNGALKVAVRGKSYRFTPTRMVDAGEDFDWAMFDVALQDS